MSFERGKRQMTLWELLREDRGEAPNVSQSDEPRSATNNAMLPGTAHLLEVMLERDNLIAALKRVKQNGGSPGPDGMTTDELLPYLREHWEAIKSSLLSGTYRPTPVLQCSIPKVGGGRRDLGIPTALDRFVQQALLQVLQPLFDPTFSDHSYGFRPKRRGHDAVRRAQSYVEAGYRYVVDLDVEKFFDRVNHDVLMNRLSRRIEDRRVLRLIRHYLESGVMVNGVVQERHAGTPQGGPLSPLLANVLLDEIDQELEKRGHAFVRYADDLNVYCKSKRAGQRVYAHLISLLGRLRLQVNESKSAVASVWVRSFLGFGFWPGPKGRARIRIEKKRISRFRSTIRTMTKRSRGRSLDHVVKELQSYLQGWSGYFRLANTPGVFRDLDAWVRHRLRALHLYQWKRGGTTFRELRARGASVTLAAEIARGTRRWWWNASKRLHHVLTNSSLADLGLPSLAKLTSTR